ncbi:hypothetical protein C8Q73DRAFT_796303 [Cubamyces lactineus]|nr:hypothetical protein C8Q73DRAFT_796303 [Cubamyces lactineus]
MEDEDIDAGNDITMNTQPEHQRVLSLPRTGEKCHPPSSHTYSVKKTEISVVSSRKDRERQRKKKRRCDARRAARSDALTRAPRPCPEKHVLDVQTLSSTQDVSYLRIARGGYVGKRVQNCREVRTVEQLLGDGFTYFAWDGKSPHILLDVQGRILAILAGHPDDDSWESVAQEASNAMEDH